MLEGCDYEFYLEVSEAVLGYILKRIELEWGSGVVVSGDGVVRGICEVDCSALYELGELVVYRDEESRGIWDRDGYLDEHSDTAILVMWDADGLYLTYGYAKEIHSGFIGKLVSGII
jgi:hypothetical protein